MAKPNWKAILGGCSLVLLLISTIVGYIYAEGTGSRDRDAKIIMDYSTADIVIRREQQVLTEKNNIQFNEIMLALGKLQGTVEQIATHK